MKELIKKLIQFRDERNWKQFHTPNNMAMKISIEAGELLECFEWKNKQQVEELIELNKTTSEVSDEIADVLTLCFIMCHDLKLDPLKIVEEKLEKTKMKYPVEESFGSNKKYDNLKGS